MIVTVSKTRARIDVGAVSELSTRARAFWTS